MPGPGTYLDPIPEKEIEDIKETANFKSKVNRNPF